MISRLDTTEERICELEIISNKSLKTRKQRLRKKDTEQNTQVLRDKYKICNLQVVGIPEGEEKEKKIYVKQ